VTKIISVDKTKKKIPDTATYRKTNFRLIISSHSFTNRENLPKIEKIGPVDFEIIGLTGIVKNK